MLIGVEITEVELNYCLDTWNLGVEVAPFGDGCWIFGDECWNN